MGNTVVVFRLFTPSGLLQLLFSSCAPIFNYTLQNMEARKASSSFITKYLKEQDHSSEEEKEAESFEFDDFEPFMVLFRWYRMELSEAEKQSLMAKGLITLRENPHMPYIMSKMFDFDLETSDIEKDLFAVS